jgi:hypothetical protein
MNDCFFYLNQGAAAPPNPPLFSFFVFDGAATSTPRWLRQFLFLVLNYSLNMIKIDEVHFLIDHLSKGSKIECARKGGRKKG